MFQVPANPEMQLSDAEDQLRVNSQIQGDIYFTLRGKPLDKSLHLRELDLGDSSFISVRSGVPAPEPKRQVRQKVRDPTFNIFRRGRLTDRLPPPADFEARIAVLQDVADFSREDCVEALQNSFYDVNRACSVLIAKAAPQAQHDSHPVSDFVRLHKDTIDELCKTTTLTRAEVIQLHYLHHGNKELTRAVLATC
jgi:hypothetical protein